MLIGLRDEFDYFQCVTCGCLQIAEPPPDLGRYYPSDYYAFTGLSSHRLHGLKTYLRRARTEYRLQGRGLIGSLLTRLTGPADVPEYLLPARLHVDDRILDVGCGNGRMLGDLAQQGFSRLTGIDPFLADDTPMPAGVHLARRFLEEMDGQYDCIILNHAFEHMPDPSGTFALLRALLTPAGTIVLRIPVVPSLAWETYGIDWFQLDAPRHFFLHSPESIRILAERNGLVIKQIVYDSDARQFWGSEQYRRNIPHLSPASYKVDPAASLFTKPEMDAFEERARTLNREGRGDQASFYLTHGSMLAGATSSGDADDRWTAN